eukprot:1138293-Pelagomonas_calceolata.AAC.1
MLFILYVIRITDITDWRSTVGPNSLFNSKSVNSQPESGNVAKDMRGKIQIYVFSQSIRRVNGMSSSDRKCAPLMVRVCQPSSAVKRCDVDITTRVSSGAKADVCVENILKEETFALRCSKMVLWILPQEGSAKRLDSTSVADCPVLCLAISKERPISGWHTSCWDSICFQKPDERMQPICDSQPRRLCSLAKALTRQVPAIHGFRAASAAVESLRRLSQPELNLK